MTLELFLDDSCRLFSDVSHLSIDAEADAIWVIPCSNTLTTEYWEKIQSVFESSRLLVWHISDGGGASPRMRDHKRALGKWKDLSTDVVRMVDIEAVGDQPKYYSDVSLANHGRCSDLALFSARSTFGIDSAVSLVPADGCVRDVADCFSMYERAFLLRQSSKTIQRTDKIDQALSDYVSSTAERGGAASILFRNSDFMPLLVIIGRRGPIEFATTANLRAYRRLQKFLSRGVDLAICG